MDLNKSSGLILHPTSLPSSYGIGDLGKESYEFICLLYTSPSPRDVEESRMPSSA